MNSDRLKKILADHKVWLRTGKQSGKIANLEGADLSGAHLNGADLRNAVLYGANLSGAYLYGANLSGANLNGAHLNGAFLNGAFLNGAFLYSANLTGAHFELEFKSVKYFQNAIFSESAIPWVILHPRWSEFADSVKFV
jgi:uncharacterized protein YjbI with pentapeptide repeats